MNFKRIRAKQGGLFKVLKFNKQSVVLWRYHAYQNPNTRYKSKSIMIMCIEGIEYYAYNWSDAKKLARDYLHSGRCEQYEKTAWTVFEQRDICDTLFFDEVRGDEDDNNHG